MKATALVAWNLRRLRVSRAVPQDILAADAEVDRTYVSRLERGLENPTIGVLERLANTLNFHISELFIEPAPGEHAPQSLRGGRKSRR